MRIGLFSPTEAGAFAVAYAAIIGLVVYRELSFKKLQEVLRDTVEDNAVILLIISMASITSYVLSYAQFPQAFAKLILESFTSPEAVLWIILGFLLLAGTIMEGTVNILLLTPIFLPMIQQVGYDPVHFGILMAILIQIGGVTPPVGVNMFKVCSLSGVPVGEFLKDSWPFLISLILVVILLALVPELSMFLPNLLMP
jgi:tripartite ATP-independent transporter DctM subunit